MKPICFAGVHVITASGNAGATMARTKLGLSSHADFLVDGKDLAVLPEILQPKTGNRVWLTCSIYPDVVSSGKRVLVQKYAEAQDDRPPKSCTGTRASIRFPEYGSSGEKQLQPLK